MERLLLTVIDHGELPKIKPKSAATDASTVKWVERGILVVEERTQPSAPGAAQHGCPCCLTPKTRPTTTSTARLVARTPVLCWGSQVLGKRRSTHLIAEVLAAGQQVLFLVPEIALTTQLIARLRRFFGDVVHVYHSRFSTGTGTETWMTVLHPKGGQLIVGARSAVLLPLPKLGLVVVDEEHEPSFKQHDPAPRYHARDVALVAVRQNVSRWCWAPPQPWKPNGWCQQGPQVVRLTERFGGAMLPEIFVADLKQGTQAKEHAGWIQQDASRRDGGHHEGGPAGHLVSEPPWLRSAYQCTQCGHVSFCERCDIPLVVHKPWADCIATIADITSIPHHASAFLVEALR